MCTGDSGDMKMHTKDSGLHRKTCGWLWKALKETWRNPKSNEGLQDTQKGTWRTLKHTEISTEGSGAVDVLAIPAKPGWKTFLPEQWHWRRGCSSPSAMGSGAQGKGGGWVYAQSTMLTSCIFQDGELAISTVYLKRKKRSSAEKNNHATNPSEFPQCWLQNQDYFSKKMLLLPQNLTLTTNTASNLILPSKKNLSHEKNLFRLNLKSRAKPDYLLD